MKKSLIILLLICTLICALFICSCGNKGNDTNTDTSTETDTDTSTNDDIIYEEPDGYKVSVNDTIAFKVTALDSNGNPIQNAVVRYTYLDGSEKMDFTDSTGSVTKTVTMGDVYISIEDSASKKSYYLVVKELTEQGAEFYAYLELESTRVHDNGTPDEENIDDDRRAYITREEGKYYATGLANQNVIFFLFVPTRDGVYQFSVDIDADIGYYGAPINANQKPIQPYPDENGNLTIEIKNMYIGDSFDSTTPYLIGIKADELDVNECLFEIKRVGDPEYTIHDQPYHHVTNTKNPQSINLGYLNWAVITNDIDITSDEITVVLGSDGYYHLNSADGELVYVRVGSDSSYLPSFYTMCETSPMSAYIYDENGNFVRKEMYNALINQYYALADKKTGLYPLDELMATAIKNHGNATGWWNPSSPNFRFAGIDLNTDNAWLFACCTIEIDETAGTEATAPIEVEKSLEDDIQVEQVMMSNGTKLYFKITSPVDSTLKVIGVPQGVIVTYAGEQYTAENGTIIVSIVKATSLEFTIEYEGQEQKLISFTIS